MLIGSLLGGSSIGVISNYIPVKSKFAINAWRSGINCIYFIIPAFIELYIKRKEINFKEIFSFKRYMFIMVTLLMNLIWVFGLLFASSRTIQSHTYVLNNVHGLFLVLINLVIGKTVVSLEKFGVLFTIVGCTTILFDPNAGRVGAGSLNAKDQALIGNLVNMGSAFFGALYFLMNAKNVKMLPICSLILFQYIHLFMLNAIFAKTFASESEPIEIFSMDKEKGCFGFFDPEIAGLAFGYFGIFSSVLGSAGYIICLLFYPPQVVCNAYLLEPFIAQFLGYWLGIDKIPGLLTFVGTLVTLAGVILIDKGSKASKQKENDSKFFE